MTEWLLCLGCRCRVPVIRGETKPVHRTATGAACGYSGPMQYLAEPSVERFPLAQQRPQLRVVKGSA